MALEIWNSLDETSKHIIQFCAVITGTAVAFPILRKAFLRARDKYRNTKEMVDWVLNDKHDHAVIMGLIKGLTDMMEGLSVQFKDQFEHNGGTSFRDALDQLLHEMAFMSSQIRAAYNTSSKAIFETDAEGKVVFVNRAFVRMTGFSAHEVMGLGWVNLIHRSNRDKVVTSWMHAVNAGRDFDEEIIYNRPDGDPYDVHALAYTIKVDGRLLGYTGEIIPIPKVGNSEKA
jgi:PAS domain S-box-containing protein